MHSLAVLSLLGLAAARPRGCRATAPTSPVGQAIYFMTNDAENSVVAIPIGSDGTLSGGVLTSTGGAGSNAVNADNKPAVPDALVSQSALTLVGTNIFAVNAGSNTLSMLTIDAADPTKLTLVGEPVSLPGEFPNTVAASAKHSLVCVGTTGAVAGISCASFSDAGLGAMDELRPIDLGQTTPPVGPTNTVSQVFFSGDQESLFVTVKGDPAVNKTGFLSVFPVEQDCANMTAVERRQNCKGGRCRDAGEAGANAMTSVLSTQDVRSSPNGTAVLFGSLPIPGTQNVFATDASFGAAILSIDADSDEASVVASQAIDGQSATCWVTISDGTNTAFVTDVGVNRVVEMSLENASIVSVVDLSENGDPGLIDLRAAGDFVYALSPGNGDIPAAVTVLDISGGAGTARQKQHFVLDGVAGANSMGMAVLV